jgi:hypothetical protein
MKQLETRTRLWRVNNKDDQIENKNILGFGRPVGLPPSSVHITEWIIK